MHALPDLEWIEKKYQGKSKVVIGLNSAKFNNEKETENREAKGRYEISHSVVADMNNHHVRVFDLDKKVLRILLVKE